MATNSSNSRTTPVVTMTELENAINWWRSKYPAPRDSMTLCAEAALLAEVYAQWIWEGRQSQESNEVTPAVYSLMSVAASPSNGPSHGDLTTMAKAA